MQHKRPDELTVPAAVLVSSEYRDSIVPDFIDNEASNQRVEHVSHEGFFAFFVAIARIPTTEHFQNERCDCGVEARRLMKRPHRIIGFPVVLEAVRDLENLA